jgi:8-oxo-dGTP pyrophosphatase MutT (NUDIX family)
LLSSDGWGVLRVEPNCRWVRVERLDVIGGVEARLSYGRRVGRTTPPPVSASVPHRVANPADLPKETRPKQEKGVARVPVPVYAVVLVLVENSGHYLLVQEAKPDRGDPWFIPAGSVEPGESIIEAAKRETLEEAGLVIEPRYLMRIEHVVPRGQDRQHPHPELWRFVLVAEATGGKLKTAGDDDSLQAQWFRPEQFGGLKLRSDEVVDLVEMHRQGAALLPIEAYVSWVAYVRC